jgi:hypothetical protein|tara:strand:+ start:28979 stop:30883 length:1905 start_codon:yes stop_codon:yes gene_type:complete
MKLFSLFAILSLSITSVYSQKSEDYIPTDAVTVFSLNNIALLQKVSLDDLVKYEFMAELEQELFDGSTSGKSIKESGIDFDQKLNIFYGKGDKYEVAGFSFGIKDINQLFTVFDDFDEQVSPLENVKYYTSYFNHLLIRGKVGLLIRVDPLSGAIRQVADSIWYSRGNENVPYYYYEGGYLEEDLEPIDEDYLEEEWDEAEPATEEVFDVEDELEVLEDGDDYIYDEDIASKNYAELRDSVYNELQQEYLNRIVVDLIVNNRNLRKEDKDLASLLEHTSEGVFYLDNSRNVAKSQSFFYLQSILPALHNEIKDLYTGNKIMGDLLLNESSIEAKMTANYGEALGSIYSALNDTKFDKKTTKYIHKDNSAYFTYNVNLRQAYEKAYEIVMPLLRDEKNNRVATSVLTIELLNALVDKDAVFDTYRGSMFGTFNGVKKVMVRRIDYTYDEDFNYTETEVESEEDLPIFTLGFSTKRNDIPNIVLEQLAKVTSECKNMGKYWIFENAILNSVPLYIINKNDLFILTNDEDLAVNHSDGYGADKISRKQIKKTKKSGFVYGQIDWSKTISQLPRELFTAEQNELLDAMRGKTGMMTLTSSKTSNTSTNFNINYDFNGTYDNPGQYILDLVNSLYILMK